eukprot:TRINITY_DN10116_c0_g1_i1.p1 TRINITY_DN10116_c0_g1~~TRINITY_DN10116_c0_g1_i1.p1  ORF type:complete len:162 (+),score=74.64 TRINITY_DN10116_c0_g1_i1:45-530(+)
MATYGLKVTVADLDGIAAAEEAGYPADEMASKAVLKDRIEQANEFFLKSEDEQGGLIGFVCGTLSAGEALEEETMSGHDPKGTHLCIHSVCTTEAHRRKGHARKLLTAYLAAVRQMPHLTRISLIAKENLTGFYQSVGFDLVGLSPIVHGADPWFDLTIKL